MHLRGKNSSFHLRLLQHRRQSAHFFKAVLMSKIIITVIKMAHLYWERVPFEANWRYRFHSSSKLLFSLSNLNQINTTIIVVCAVLAVIIIMTFVQKKKKRKRGFAALFWRMFWHPQTLHLTFFFSSTLPSLEAETVETTQLFFFKDCFSGSATISVLFWLRFTHT